VAHYQQAVVLYVGDGSVDRLIETPFPLDSGAVAIWIFEWRGAFVATSPKFRHNGPLMTETVVCDGALIQGITAFTAAGFVIDHQTVNGVSGSVNTLGNSYAAVVMRDSAPGGEILRVGTYAGAVTHSVTFWVLPGGPGTAIETNTFTPADVGLEFTVQGNPQVFTLTSWTSALAATMWPAWDGSRGNPITGATQVDNRLIVVGDADWVPTHVWVCGRGIVYRSDDFTGDSSLDLFGEIGKPTTNNIQGFVVAGDVAGFQIGTDNNVNDLTLTYHWLACRFTPAVLAYNFFRSFRITSTPAPIDQVTGLGFTPLVAIAMRYGTTVRYRRQPQHTDTQSSTMEGFSNAAGGIDALGPGTIDLGEDVAAVGPDVYGFAWAPADFDNSPTLPAGCPVSFSVPLTAQPASCPLVDFPH
jgi:hypothetical protein